MKIKLNAFLSIILLCAIIISCVPASAATSTGLTFEPIYYYDTAAQTFPLPSAYEAVICLPQHLRERGGVVIGNYSGEEKPLFGLEIFTNGNPRLFINAPSNDTALANYDIRFTEVNVATGEPVHLAITMDYAAKAWMCYVDGKLEQTINQPAPKPFEMTEKIRLGGDFRSGNSQYFKGTIQKVALYSNVRTDQQIADDAFTAEIATDSLICGYDLSANIPSDCPEIISSVSGAAFDLVRASDWLEEAPEPKDYAYSFAVLGDIQTITNYYPDQLTTLYGWIRDNAESKKIKYVVGLGDITDKNLDSEYRLVKNAYDLIDGVVPFSIIRGNHDSASATLFPSAMYDTHITQEKYGDEITGAYDKTMLNTYRILQVGQVKYLFMNLDYLLKDEVLTWANEIISQNADCQVIVTTHIYIRGSHSYSELDTDSGTLYGSENNGEDLWYKLLSKHENIVMVLSGHHPTDDILYRQTTGENGNKVTEILIDPQDTDKAFGGTGMVAMFYFSEDGKQLEVQYYSTVKDAYFKDTNQFSLTLDVPTEPKPPIWIPIVIVLLVIGAAAGIILWKKKKR